jgi:poly [ADP-ribose] polymerase
VAKKEQPVSTLPGKVQDLVRLMFDMRMMASKMKEIGYDAKKMPLGKLAKASIVKGYEILKRLMDEIKGKCRLDTLSGLSGEFYSEIPHDFGFKKMSNFVLKSEQLVKEKLEMLQSLEDIQIFTKLIDEGSTDSDVNELDSNYAKLNISIVPMDHSSDTYRLLEKYVKNTHASTHTAYKLEVL